MKDIHDITFKSLMHEREFFQGFFKTYLPAKVYQSIDWDSSHVFNISGEHIREVFPFENQKQLRITKDIADLAYIVNRKKDGKSEQALLTLHIEHQNKPDKLLPLRMSLYILGMLYEFAKINKTDKLPHVHAIIYYQGKQSPYPYAKDLSSMFPKDYLFGALLKPIFVDLGQIPDETLLAHKETGAAEIAFKHIHEKNLLPYADFLATSIKNLNDNSTKTVLQYILKASSGLDNSDEQSQKFIESLTEKLPEKKEIIMSLIDQLTKKKFIEAARKLLSQGVSPEVIKASLGIDVKKELSA